MAIPAAARACHLSLLLVVTIIACHHCLSRSLLLSSHCYPSCCCWHAIIPVDKFYINIWLNSKFKKTHLVVAIACHCEFIVIACQQCHLPTSICCSDVAQWPNGGCYCCNMPVDVVHGCSTSGGGYGHGGEKAGDVWCGEWGGGNMQHGEGRCPIPISAMN